MTEKKDRLVQARVPEALETSLKQEARRRRTTVSQMVRDVLEDAFQLVDGVVANVDQIVTDSARLAGQVGQVAADARRRRTAMTASPANCGEPLPDSEEALARVHSWNAVVLNQGVPCTRCGSELRRGARAYLGASDQPEAPRTWLCVRAVEALGDEES